MAKLSDRIGQTAKDAILERCVSVLREYGGFAEKSAREIVARDGDAFVEGILKIADREARNN